MTLFTHTRERSEDRNENNDRSDGGRVNRKTITVRAARRVRTRYWSRKCDDKTYFSNRAGYKYDGRRPLSVQYAWKLGLARVFSSPARRACREFAIEKPSPSSLRVVNNATQPVPQVRRRTREAVAVRQPAVAARLHVDRESVSHGDVRRRQLDHREYIMILYVRITQNVVHFIGQCVTFCKTLGDSFLFFFLPKNND